VSLTFLTSGNASDYGNATLEAMVDAVAEAAGVEADDIEVVVDEVEEEISQDVVEGNMTLSADLSDVNATLLASDLADAYNISASMMEVDLSAASVLLSFTVTLPNCSAPLAEYDSNCEGSLDGDVPDGAMPDVEALVAAIEDTSEAVLSERLGVPIAARSLPHRRLQQRLERSTRFLMRIRSLDNATEAADTAALLNSGGADDSSASIFESAAALEAAMATKGVSLHVRGRPAPPLVDTVSANGVRTAVRTKIVRSNSRFPVTLRAGVAVLPLARVRTVYLLSQFPTGSGSTLNAKLPRAKSHNGNDWNECLRSWLPDRSARWLLHWRRLSRRGFQPATL
jgi:hypothetical protein